MLPRRKAAVRGATICDDGEYLNSSTCVACSEGCKSCSSGSQCNECWSDNFTLTGGYCDCPSGQVNYLGTDCLTCTTGQYWSTTLRRCVECSSNCSECTGKKDCTTCEDPYTLTSTNICKCEGYTNRYGDCIVCADDTMYYDGTEC